MNKDLLYTLRWNIQNPDETTKAENLKILSALLGETPRETEYSIANPAIKTDPVSISPALSGPRAKVALVIGHNPKNKGADIKAGINQFEYDFNGEIASIMLAKAWEGLEMQRFYRKYLGSYSREISEVYGRVNAWNPDLILEMHFNSYPGGDYSFMLYHHRSARSKKLAGIFNETFCENTGFKSNQENAAITPGGRGYQSLAKSKAPCILTEPFFENCPEHQELISEIGHEGVADIYLHSLNETLREL